MSIKNKKKKKLEPGDLIVWTCSNTIVQNKPRADRYLLSFIREINSGIRRNPEKLHSHFKFVPVGGLGLLIAVDETTYTYMQLTRGYEGQIFSAALPEQRGWLGCPNPEKVCNRTFIGVQ